MNYDEILAARGDQLNAKQRRVHRRTAVRLAQRLLPTWRQIVALGGGYRTELARGHGLIVEGDAHDEPAVYVLREYRVGGEVRHEVLHREPPVVGCPDCGT